MAHASDVGFFFKESISFLQLESELNNNSVLCYLKGKSRKLCHFKVVPPDVGQYFLKIYAKPEADITDENEELDHVATMLIHVIQVIIFYQVFTFKKKCSNLMIN